jgi:mRNA interferase MazF
VVPLAAGLVVLVRFPFSDLSQTKLRPAVVLASAGRGDWILCQVTSKPYADSAAVVLRPSIFNTVGYRSRAMRGPANSLPRVAIWWRV